MASVALERLRSEALNLSEAERAELAHALVTSLDGLPDADAQNAWEIEIVRRIGEVEAGTAEPIDRDEFRRRMRSRPKA
ncbi:MAG: addiction module protein [Gammaproteobacteria bacterium]|nr:addiction module protein [Gammaproteobacteria bacterium]MBI5615151.1 addiction module protein [Gammaproteobacteria bacterium]